MEVLGTAGGCIWRGVVGRGSFGPPFTPWPQISWYKRGEKMEYLRIAKTSIWSCHPAVQSPGNYRQSLGRKLWIFNHAAVFNPIFVKKVSGESTWNNVRQILSQGLPNASERVLLLMRESVVACATIVSLEMLRPLSASDPEIFPTAERIRIMVGNILCILADHKNGENSFHQHFINSNQTHTEKNVLLY